MDTEKSNQTPRHLGSKTYFSTAGPLAPPLWAYREGNKSIDLLSVQVNDFHDDFQQTLNGTDLFTRIKAEYIRYHGMEWQQLAVMPIPRKCNIFHTKIISYDENSVLLLPATLPWETCGGRWQCLGRAGATTGPGVKCDHLQPITTL